MAIVFWNFEGLALSVETPTSEPRTCFIKLRPTRPELLFARPRGCLSFAERSSNADEFTAPQETTTASLRNTVCSPFDAGDFPARRVRMEAQHLRFGDNRDVGLLHDRPDGDNVGVRLRADQAGIDVAGVATDARAEVHQRFVDAHPHRRGIRFHAARFQDLKNLL